MFFKLNSENCIGVKRLTKADLGFSREAHQTHIGLFNNVLKFLPDHSVVDDCMLFYDETFLFVTGYFDRITRANGRVDAIKSRIGNSENSLVKMIREVASRRPGSTWYLVWFGLDNDRPVFILASDGDDDDNMLQLHQRGLDFSDSDSLRVYTPSDRLFALLKSFVEELVNRTAIEIPKTLETDFASDKQIEINKHLRRFDIERANKLFSEIGRSGEKLIDAHFHGLLCRNEIKEYVWNNADKETGMPYDFSYKDNVGDLWYLDVKTTNYDFSQKIIFSFQELKFACENLEHYLIYRVYKKADGTFALKIGRDVKRIFGDIQVATLNYLQSLTNCSVESITFSVYPSTSSIEFGEEIIL